MQITNKLHYTNINVHNMDDSMVDKSEGCVLSMKDSELNPE